MNSDGGEADMSLTDYEKIQNHLARYCFAVDGEGADEIAALFWTDATLEFGGLHRGYGEIHACYRNWISEMRDPVEGLRHLIHMPLIEVNGDTAVSKCYADADAHSRKSDRPIQNRAVYLDILTKRDGEWRFMERRIVWMKGLQQMANARSPNEDDK